MQELTNSNFDETIKSSTIPVFVKFWAEWCGPCKAVQPIIDKLIEEYKDKVNFYSVNVDNGEMIASRYKVMSIPYFLLFVNGMSVDQIIGAVSIENLRIFINTYIEKKDETKE